MRKLVVSSHGQLKASVLFYGLDFKKKQVLFISELCPKK